MAATPSSAARIPAPKLCPRCGAFYQDIASQTCPQCFAKLAPLNERDASALIAQQDERALDPEFLKLKQADDEKFREQSFGACLGVGLVLTLMVVVSVVFVVVAAHRRSGTAPIAMTTRRYEAQVRSLQSPGAQPADFDRFVPLRLADANRVTADSDLALPGGAAPIYHGQYANGCQVYGVPGRLPSDEQLGALRLAAAFVAEQQKPALIEQEVATAKAQYIVIGPDEPTVRGAADALARLH